MLASYLGKKALTKKQQVTQAIFTFGFNASQKSATEKAFAVQMSVIEGPPGTDKTQTILNIIANAVLHNQTVAVVSNNNSAIANILDKLKKYDLDFIVAYLGNNMNKQKFFIEQTGKYPDVKEWVLEESEYKIIKSNVEDSLEELNEMLEFNNKRAIVHQELSRLQTEYKYSKDYYVEYDHQRLRINSFFQMRPEKLLKIVVEYKYNVEKGKIKLARKIYNFFVHGIYNFDMYKHCFQLPFTG